jgi:UDP:flavonoid glycosyltransferase YjiC (YdhE family)
MRIGLYTWGSEGDVRPFVALAAGLAARGHDVRLGYSAIDGRDWSAVCAPLGFRARAVGADEIAKARASDGPHNTALLGKGNPGKQIYDVVVGLLDPVVEAMWADAEESAADLDVAVVHLLAHPAMTAALARAIPVATVQPAPVTPTRELAPLGAPESAWLRPLSWWLADRVSRLWLVPRINAFRARAGVAPRKAMFPADDVALSMTCVSPTLVSRPSDWPPHEIITGFFELAGHAHAWERPEALDRFLADGEAPWLMGFGSMLSMPGEETNQCVRTMLEAVDRAGARALVQAPWSELPAMPESPRVFRLGRAPHAEILPHCRGMVHHGGAGTTQAACLAGRPSVVVPFLGDQPFWAGRLRALGIAPAPVPRRSLDARRLAEAMQALDADAGARSKAEAIGAKMRAEDGVRVAAEQLERLVR